MYRSLPFGFASKQTNNLHSIAAQQRTALTKAFSFSKGISIYNTHTHKSTANTARRSIHPIRACALLPSDAGSHVGSLLLNTGDFSIAEWFLHHPGAPHKHTNTHNGYECISQHRETQRTYRSRRTGHYVAGVRARSRTALVVSEARNAARPTAQATRR